MTQTPPNEVIIDRAVVLWKRAISNPKYQIEIPERQTESTMMSSVLASLIPNNSTLEIIDNFGVALKDIMMNLVQGHSPEYKYYEHRLAVDYQPCASLRKAADIAGLKMEFPYKTSMNIEQNYLTWRYGYGAETEYHYPLPDGRWLITTLNGGDIQKVIEYVMGGKPDFIIEAGA